MLPMFERTAFGSEGGLERSGSERLKLGRLKDVRRGKNYLGR